MYFAIFGTCVLVFAFKGWNIAATFNLLKPNGRTEGISSSDGFRFKLTRGNNKIPILKQVEATASGVKVTKPGPWLKQSIGNTPPKREGVSKPDQNCRWTESTSRQLGLASCPPVFKSGFIYPKAWRFLGLASSSLAGNAG